MTNIAESPNLTTPPRAKDWQALQNVLQSRVRTPLKATDDYDRRWLGSKLGDQWHPPKKGRGQVGSKDGRTDVLAYTLYYSCMHYDAFCKLMQQPEFCGPLSSALAGNDPSVLHVDFGCGPGTASWAVANALASNVRITTVGHDHNQHTIELAQEMAQGLASGALRQRHSSFFHHDPTAFRANVRKMLSEHRWSTVLVTANSVFGQALTDLESLLSKSKGEPAAPHPVARTMAELIVEMAELTDSIPFFVAGTHPRYSPDQVQASWQQIESIPSTDVLYKDWLSIVSGAPTQYHDTAPWYEWTPLRQLGHVFRISPRRVMEDAWVPSRTSST